MHQDVTGNRYLEHNSSQANISNQVRDLVSGGEPESRFAEDNFQMQCQ